MGRRTQKQRRCSNESLCFKCKFKESEIVNGGESMADLTETLAGTINIGLAGVVATKMLKAVDGKPKKCKVKL
jgi:hypothetical protein